MSRRLLSNPLFLFLFRTPPPPPQSHFLVIFLSTLSVHFVIDSVAHDLPPPSSSNHSHTPSRRGCVSLLVQLSLSSPSCCFLWGCSVTLQFVLLHTCPFSPFQYILSSFLFSFYSPVPLSPIQHFADICFSFCFCFCSFIFFPSLHCSSLTVKDRSTRLSSHHAFFF